ncbi:hypothetical protein BCR36DRAFT_72848 [Piromyces finnis]|uniref:Uncharacterized protein n=1 Tax=Piromyces finnis TaxID=1754191 RepID=A0A1Y1V804_9FUNG|nr:hypothetical protein BCR36DRAFT_72848 [Piromyces finnis]|eukprot:ORX48670.1 hypothetical protein BCR36DRAFT_72848 [Piromyces finnis]
MNASDYGSNMHASFLEGIEYGKIMERKRSSIEFTLRLLKVRMDIKDIKKKITRLNEDELSIVKEFYYNLNYKINDLALKFELDKMRLLKALDELGLATQERGIIRKKVIKSKVIKRKIIKKGIAKKKKKRKDCIDIKPNNKNDGYGNVNDNDTEKIKVK